MKKTSPMKKNAHSLAKPSSPLSWTEAVLNQCILFQVFQVIHIVQICNKVKAEGAKVQISVFLS